MNTDNANHSPWLYRLEELFEKKDSKKSALADALGISKGTVTGWFRNVKSGPAIATFAAIADYFGVSLDYLWGKSACETPKNEEIHKETGLSDKAINRLKQANNKASANVSVEKKLAICNYLIESMNKSAFFDNLYDYLFGEFHFQSKDETQPLGATVILSKSPSGKESKAIAFSSVFSEAQFALVQRDLIRMKDIIEKPKETLEKSEYEKWEKEHHEEQMGRLAQIEDENACKLDISEKERV